MKMQPFDAYTTYLGIKTHFKSKSYSFQKFGKSKAKYETFCLRKDRYFFEKITRKFTDEEILGIYVSNLMQNCDVWVGDLLTEDAQKTYMSWKKRNENLRYLFKADCDLVIKSIEGQPLSKLFTAEEGKYPIIVQLLLQNKIMPETFVIFDKIFEFMQILNKQYENDVVWSSLMLKFEKYSPFVETTPDDIIFYKKLVLSKVEEYNIHKYPRREEEINQIQK